MAFEGFDLSKVDLSGLLNEDVVKKVSEKAETNEETTKSVIGNALPLLGALFSSGKTDGDVTEQLAASTNQQPGLIQKILTAIIPFILNLFSKKDDAKEEEKEENEGLLGGLASGLTNLFTGRQAAAEEEAEDLKEKAEDVKEAVEEKVEDVKEAVEEKVEEIKEKVEEKAEEVKETAEEKAEDAKEEKDGLLGNLKEGLGNLASTLSGLFTGRKDD